MIAITIILLSLSNCSVYNETNDSYIIYYWIWNFVVCILCLLCIRDINTSFARTFFFNCINCHAFDKFLIFYIKTTKIGKLSIYLRHNYYKQNCVKSCTSERGRRRQERNTDCNYNTTRSDSNCVKEKGVSRGKCTCDAAMEMAPGLCLLYASFQLVHVQNINMCLNAVYHSVKSTGNSSPFHVLE